MSLPHSNDPASILLVEEYFAREDAGFVEALRRVTHPKVLAAFADRWKRDPRPWARAQIFVYLERPLDCPGHQPLVKHLFKDAEERKDDELMAAFLTAFDTLIRRVRRAHWSWDRSTRSGREEERLEAPRDVLPAEIHKTFLHPKTGQRVTISKTGRKTRGGRIFTHRTRHYLRRRAWRYFRWMGYGRPAAYPAAVVNALRRYRDADLEKGEHILDSWALLQICFYGGDVIEFKTRHDTLRAGKSLGDLRVAPRFGPAWDTPEAAGLVLSLVVQAQAKLVRLWAMDLFRTLTSREAVEVSADQILGFIDHEDERVQAFGAELFESQSGNEKLPVSTWLRLLGTRNVTVLATLCAAFARHVSAERLTLAQCLELAMARPVPVARLGFQLLQGRSFATAELPSLIVLAEARCASLAAELATWALARVGAREHYELEAVSRFFDSISQPTRDAAWAWLTAGAVNPSTSNADARSAGYDDPVLWSRLAETPFDDLRLKIVDHLALRLETPALSVDQLAPVWCAVLLGVHRGGRQKLKAVRELAEAIAREPETAARLLPVLVVAVRSVRGPEMRAGLSAVMTLIARRPELSAMVKARLPELSFQAEEEAVA